MRAELLLSAALLAGAAFIWGLPQVWPQSSAVLPSFSSGGETTAASSSPTLSAPAPSSQAPEEHHNGDASSASSARELLLRSLGQLRAAPPLVAQLDLQINLLNREFRGTGQYCQTGSGVPQSRWDLTLGNPPGGLQLSQIFDGRFFYRLTIQGDQRTLHYVDLYGARDLPVVNTAGVAGPAGWLGVGGLPTMLEQLLATHEFEEPDEPEIVRGTAGQSLTLTRIRGRWSKAALRQLLRDQIPPEVLAGEIMWERLPGQMPHAVELVVGSDEYLDAFPYRLAFYQFQSAGKGEYRVQPIFEIKLHHVEKREAIAPEQFRLSADGLNPIDDKDYLNRVKLFTLYPAKN